MLISCPECKKQISDTAVTCPSCGYPIQSQKTCNPGIAALLSFVLPGAGQIYRGNLFRGLMWFVFIAIGYYCFIIPGLILHFLCILMASIE